jgi:hypothetical protein
VKEQKLNIIRDNKRRGEWAESVFIARATENGLPVSKPLGDSGSFDCVVGGPGNFVAVQVKCTMAKLHTGKGYICTVKSNNKRYRAGAFDFLAAYVIPADTWYIVPVRAIGARASICLCSPESKYEEYREAWDLLREAANLKAEDPAKEPAAEPVGWPLAGALTQAEKAMMFMQRQLERNGVLPLKRSDDM